MARGNQRDAAREKNQKKLAQQAKGQKTESGASLKARQHEDAEKMRQKQAAALAKKEAEAAAGAAVKK